MRCLSTCIRTFAVVLFLLGGAVQAQVGYSDCRKAGKLIKTLEAEHVLPIVLDDQASERLFHDFLADLDPEGLYFTAADIAGLEPFRLQIDDGLREGNCDFVNAVEKVYRRALVRADSLAAALLDKPFDLTKKENLVLQKSGTLHPPADVNALTQSWSRYLKYLLLDRLISPVDSSGNTPEISGADLKEREAEAREYLKKRRARIQERHLNPAAGFVQELYSTWLNALTSLYDPHSEYFSVDEKMRFDAIISNENYAYGFSLVENRSGDFKVARIAPGGAAWKTNALNEGDIIVACTIAGQAPMDLSGMDLDDFEDEISSLTVFVITLTVRKTDGRLKTVTLRKEKVKEEEGSVRGLMLEGDAKVGYIALPGFYSASDNDPQSGCGNDVAREVIKLKREGMTGLILDLRNNGGGSVREAAELAGIFLDFGPLFQQRGQDMAAFSIKDPNRGYAWKGPLVVLVNGLSASASELVAGTLQDYHRAVIVGSTTFGKSTGQIVVPVVGTGDFLKVTSSKFNRITGDSYQLAGLQPDVRVPDAYDGLDYREASYPHVLERDQIEANKYFVPGDPLPLEMLRAKSLDRIDNDTRFVRFSVFSESVKKMLDYPLEIPLEIKAFRKYDEERRHLVAELEEIFAAENRTFEVKITDADRALVEGDEVRRETYQALIDKIKKDFIVEEGYYILRDLNQ